MANLDPEYLLDRALQALSAGADWAGVLDDLPAPIYITDTEGT